MEKQLGKDYTNKDQRIAFLKDNCDTVAEKSYLKQFTPDELQQKKEQLSEASIEINDIEEEKKEMLAEIKTRLEPKTTFRKELLRDIKHKASMKKEECYKFIDQTGRMVGFYNSDGDLIESRPAFADELQGTIMQILRTGTNN